MRDMRPSMAELKEAFWPMVRGTAVGTLFGAMPGTGPTITTFIAYALERKVSKTPEKFRHRHARRAWPRPRRRSHSKTQVDFIPTMSLGIPGDAVMALILGALLIQGIQPGPQLITEHPDIFWGADRQLLDRQRAAGDPERAADRRVGQAAAGALPLSVPVGDVLHRRWGLQHATTACSRPGEVLVFGIVGAIFMALDFPVAPILLGFVLGPMVEENFRRALLLSRGDLSVFVTRPISGGFIGVCALVVIGVTWSAWRAGQRKRLAASLDDTLGLPDLKVRGDD